MCPGNMTVYEMVEAIQQYYGYSKKEAQRQFETMRSEDKLKAFYWWCERN